MGSGDHRWYPAPVTYDPPGFEPDVDPSETLADGFDPAPIEPLPAPPRHGRYGPAVLDALVPGLGPLVAGVVLATTSTARILATLLDSGVIWGLIGLQGLLLVWRLLAIGSSLTAPGLPGLGRRDALPIGLLLLFVITPQVFAGYATEVAREPADEIFVEPTAVAVLPSGSAEPDPSFLEVPSASASESATPTPSPTPAVPRITGLIVGVDSGVGRSTYLTDTMIVVSLDPVTETVSMVSIPR